MLGQPALEEMPDDELVGKPEAANLSEGSHKAMHSLRAETVG
jgi:hypothetical protein